jgi:TonB-dependent SusC/RagA subfamily outer membrane receptor
MRIGPASARVTRRGTRSRGLELGLGPLLVVLWVVVLPLPVAAQQPGSIVGRVVDSASAQPVAGAEVSLPMAKRRVLTNELGWFLVPDLTDGAHVVEVARVGYRPVTGIAEVAGDAVSLEFRLVPRPIALAGLDVVRSRAGEPPPFEVGRIDLSDEPARSGKAVDLLRRVLGADVFRANGEPGNGATVRLRGPTSIVERREPLVIVDGVPTTLITLRDMPASDVASIEVLKGAAASAEYGSRGQAGVILITTRRGRAR